MMSSPSFPGGMRFVPVSVSTMQASVSGRGMPMEESLVSSVALKCVTGEASERP